MTTFRAALCTVLLLGLGGCISLFPKQQPAQLYRFGVAEAPAQAPPPSGVFNVAHMATNFSQAAAGDRILTTNGTEAAYIAAARWASPASELFDEAEQKAFDQSGGAARLLRRGETASANELLALDVQSFEARYGDPKAPPTVVVTVHAVLLGALDRKVVGDQVFVSRVPASDNRVGAIVDAFDTASTNVLNQVVGWTDQRGGA
ncbi:MAG TPA: ABC-type transport auxiliary lipoprotein family protein [Caulobacteraceae bacterium]|nr:ABC-type transport auxiliary lipoprotein family protein [Caulobacteraceae bacterium]